MSKNAVSIVLIPAIVLVLLSCAAPGVRNEDPQGADARSKKEAFRVNGAVFTEADVDEAVDRLVPRVSFHRTVTPEKRVAYRDKAIEEMIEKELLFQEASRRGMTVDRSRIKGAREIAVKRYGSRKAFKAALKRVGLTEKQFEKELEKRFLVDDLSEVEIAQKARVTEAEALGYYEKNKSSYMRPEARRLRHILVSVRPEASAQERQRLRRRAEEALEKARKGQDFGQLAWDYSDDPYRVKGGDLGLIHRGRLDQALEDAAFKLKRGEVSGIIESIYGYHIFLVEEVKPSEQLHFDDVSQKITREMTERRRDELKDSLITRLRAEAQIEIY